MFPLRKDYYPKQGMALGPRRMTVYKLVRDHSFHSNDPSSNPSEVNIEFFLSKYCLEVDN